MPTLIEYGELMASADTGRWRAAVDRAVALTEVHAYRWTVGVGTYPDQEVPFRGLALLVYALAGQRHADPGSIEAVELAEWLARHREVNTSDLEPAGLARWLAEQHEPRRMTALAGLLADAGHSLPPRVHRVGWRATGDPVIDTWAQITMLDSGDPDPHDLFGSSAPWAEPVLPAALHQVEWNLSPRR